MLRVEEALAGCYYLRTLEPQLPGNPEASVPLCWEELGPHSGADPLLLDSVFSAPVPCGGAIPGSVWQSGVGKVKSPVGTKRDFRETVERGDGPRTGELRVSPRPRH